MSTSHVISTRVSTPIHRRLRQFSERFHTTPSRVVAVLLAALPAPPQKGSNDEKALATIIKALGLPAGTADAKTIQAAILELLGATTDDPDPDDGEGIGSPEIADPSLMSERQIAQYAARTHAEFQARFPAKTPKAPTKIAAHRDRFEVGADGNVQVAKHRYARGAK